jgi:hypothetical protein
MKSALEILTPSPSVCPDELAPKEEGIVLLWDHLPQISGRDSSTEEQSPVNLATEISPRKTVW